MTTRDTATFLDTLNVGPDELKHALTELAHARHDQTKVEREMKLLRNMLLSDIANATGEDGKKLYTNETARNAALAELLEKDDVCQSLQSDLDLLAEAIAHWSIEVEYWQARISAARAAAVLLASGVEG